MIASSQPARVSIAEPAAPSILPPVAPKPTPTGDTAVPEPDAPRIESAAGITAERREDPTDHPLVKSALEKFAAKIVEVRKKSPS
jgi:hypothetical protein